MRGTLFFLLPVLMLMGGCNLFRGGRDEVHDMSYLYQPAQNALHPRFLVYHDSPEQSTLVVRLVPIELYFSAANEMVIEQAVLKFEYKLYELTKERPLVYSESVLKVYRKSEVKEDVITDISMPVEEGRQYMLEVITTDTIRGHAIQSFILVDKANPYGRQNFFPVDLSDHKPYFYNFVDTTKRVGLRYNQPGTDSLFVRFFLNLYPEAPPPNLMIPGDQIRYKPDSVWTISLNETLPVNFSMQGIYLIQSDTNQMEGITFLNFGDDYPQVKYADQMMGPLSYLMSAPDYRQMINTPNTKLAVDNFWLEVAKNMESARELIRVYYNRVFFANYYFTSYKEGWKTDRGMVYIVYGPPAILYKTDDSEEWIYGSKRSDNKITFFFDRVILPFSDNHYVLRRGETLVTRWSQAIDAWRKGKVYNVE
jgi:GWxTD domain-containing protein